MFDHVKNKILEIAFKEVDREKYIKNKKKKIRKDNIIIFLKRLIPAIFCLFFSFLFAQNMSELSLGFSCLLISITIMISPFYIDPLLKIIFSLLNKNIRYENDQVLKTELNKDELKIFDSFFEDIKKDLSDEEFRRILKKVKEITNEDFQSAYYIYYLSSNYLYLKQIIKEEIVEQERENHDVYEVMCHQLKKINMEKEISKI